MSEKQNDKLVVPLGGTLVLPIVLYVLHLAKLPKPTFFVQCAVFGLGNHIFPKDVLSFTFRAPR